MNWEIFYFVCFLVGFLLSLLTFISGSAHLHLPHGPHVHGGHAHAHGSGLGSWFNFSTITAFLAWFGGTGYLLTRYSNVWALLGLGVAALSGIGGAALVFWFLFRFLMGHEQALEAVDYSMIGVLGRVSSAVRAGGTGEMIYSQNGARRAVPIRCEDQRAIAKETEVVVIRMEKGIAFVRRWDELSGETYPADQDAVSSGPATAIQDPSVN